MDIIRRTDRRSSTVLWKFFPILAAAAAAGAWSWWNGLRSPRRVGQIPVGVIHRVRGQDLVYQAPGAVKALPLAGGRSRTVMPTHGDAAYRGNGRVFGNIEFLPSGVLYARDDGPNRRMDEPRLYYSVFERGKLPPRIEYRKVRPEELRSITPVREAGNYSAWLLPYRAGASPELIARGLNSQRVVLSGGFAYRIETRRWPPLPEGLFPAIRNGVQQVPLLPPSSLLQRSPIGGGPIENLTAIDAGAPLRAWEGGIYWVQIGSRPGGEGSALYCLKNGSRLPALLRDFGSYREPVYLDGRFYWLRQIPVRSPLDPVSADIVSTTPDLKTVSRVSRFTVRGRIWPIDAADMVASSHALYMVVSGGLAISSGPAASGGPAATTPPHDEGRIDSPRLYEIDIGRDHPVPVVRQITRFPAGTLAFQQDGNRIYADVEESRENWLNWSGHGSMLTSTILYQFTLPR